MYKAIVFTKEEWVGFIEKLPVVLKDNFATRYQLINDANSSPIVMSANWIAETAKKFLPEISSEQPIDNHIVLSDFEWGQIPMNMAKSISKEMGNNIKIINLCTGQEAVQSPLDIFLGEVFIAQQNAA